MIELGKWNELRSDGIVFTAGGGFRLPSGAVRAADAAWVRLTDWNALTKEQRDTFAPVVPEFVVEVRSPSDRLQALRSNMEEWIRNGCRLAWLIDPVDRRATIYRAGGAVDDRELEGTLPVKMFCRGSSSIWLRSRDLRPAELGARFIAVQTLAGLVRLFVPQALHRIGQSGGNGLVTHGE